MPVSGHSGEQRCPECGKPSWNPPEEVYCVDCAIGDYDPMIERTRTYPPTWRIWVCRCGGEVLWRERPRHMTCAECGALIRQIDVEQARHAG